MGQLTDRELQELVDERHADYVTEEQRADADLAYMRQKQQDPFRQSEADALTHEESMLRIMLTGAM